MRASLLTCHPNTRANEDGAGACLDGRHDQRGAATKQGHACMAREAATQSEAHGARVSTL